jgi:hypothetical protein
MTSPKDDPAIIAAFSRLRFQKRIATAIMLVAASALVYLRWLATDDVASETSMTIVVACVATMVATLVFIIARWKCPACGGRLANRFDGQLCPRCNARLQK